MQSTNDKLTITLTNRAPVTIVKADWPKVADSKGWEGEYEFQAHRKWFLNVRQHADGRAIVYGIYNTAWRGERGRRSGEIVPAGGDIVDAIVRISEALECDSQLAAECIAALPAEELM